MAESLTALSVWLLIVSFLVPQMVLLVEKRQNVKQSTIAYKILHEETQKVFFDKKTKLNTVVKENGTTYNLVWKGETSYTKACISWENHYNQTKEQCFFTS
ncbi:hypothetical protein [Metabacillus herbersteinensis]